MILSAVLVHESVFCLYLGSSIGGVSAFNSSSFFTRRVGIPITGLGVGITVGQSFQCVFRF